MVRHRTFAVVLMLLFAAEACALAQEDVTANIDLLIDALVHPDLSIRQSATRRLKQVGPTAAADLVQSVQQDFMLAAVSAGGLLAEMGGDAKPAASEALAGMLKNPQTENWRWSVAADVLGAVDPPTFDLLPVLVARLQTESPLVQDACVRAIKRLGAAADESQRDLFTDARRGLLHLLQTRDAPLSEILLDGSSTVSGQVTFRAETPWLDDLAIIEALSAAGLDADQGRQLLRERLGPRHSEQVRLAAAKQLLQLGEEGKTLAAQALAAFIRNPHSNARDAAIKSAAEVGPMGVAVVGPLADVLDADESDLREEAARSLGAIGPPAAAALPRLYQAVALERLRWPGGRNVVNVMKEAIAKIQGPEASPPAES